MYLLLTFILRLIDLYSIVLAVYALLTWFPQAYGSTLARWVSAICEPFLQYFERFRLGRLGFSVMIAIFFLQFVRYGVIAIFRMFL